MKNNDVTKIQSTDQLKSSYNNAIDYLQVTYQSCLDFEQKNKHAGNKRFSVWLFLEDEYKQAWQHKNKKSPKAETIRNWFISDPITHVKMGTEDLAFICKAIDNPSGIIAFYEDSIELFDETLVASIQKSFKIKKEENKSIKDKALHIGSTIGEIQEEIATALKDELLEPHEKKTIINSITQAVQHLMELKGLIGKGKK